MIYFDNAATTPIDPAVMARLQEVESSCYANPSSIHSAGQKSRFIIEQSRDIIAETIGCSPKEIIFTSGGTESNNLAIIGSALANREKGNHIITTGVEHVSVLNTIKYLSSIGFNVTYLDVDTNDNLNLKKLQEIITDETILVSVMMVNNEIGNILPIQEIGDSLKDTAVIFHTDAVQSFGKLQFNVNDLSVDLLSISAHKINGPKGVGALFIRSGTRINNLLFGGSQERILRPGTENLTAIAGFGKAVEQTVANINECKRIKDLRDTFEEKLISAIPNIIVHCSKSPRIFNLSNIFFPNISIDSFILNLDLEGIACSTGSACSSGSIASSHVLSAMNLPKEQISQSIRFSFGRFNTINEINKAVKIISEVYYRLKKE